MTATPSTIFDLGTTQIGGNFLSLHILRPTIGVNLNAGGDGSPKSIVIGGTKRQRVSSQSLKRAVRMHMRDTLETNDQAKSTFLLPRAVANAAYQALAAGGRSEDWESIVLRSAALLSLIGYRAKLKAPEVMAEARMEPQSFILAAGEILAKRFDAFAIAEEAIVTATEASEASKSANAEEEEARQAAIKVASEKGLIKVDKSLVDDGAAITQELEAARRLDGNAEIALNGRFIAETARTDNNVASAVAYSHAFSVDPVAEIIDYQANADDYVDGGFDDGMESDGSIGGHLRREILTSGTLYEYITLDRRQLRENIRRSSDLTTDEVKARAHAVEEVFVDSAIRAVPKAKTNATGGKGSPASFVLALASDAQPLTAASAFTKAIDDPERVTVAAAERLNMFVEASRKLTPITGGAYAWLLPVYDEQTPVFGAGITEK